jgi:hypothetical protein
MLGQSSSAFSGSRSTPDQTSAQNRWRCALQRSSFGPYARCMSGRAVSSEQLLREIDALLEDERRQVVDFVAFLRVRNSRKPRRRLVKHPPLSEDTFVGMWKDREDMADGGAALVRRLRGHVEHT